MGVDRCPICDREDVACGRRSAIRAYMDGTNPTVAMGDAMLQAQGECDLRRVDWRARALAAEARLAECRALLGEARENILAMSVNHDALIARIDAALKEGQ